jgi:hypothetical protein
MVDCRCSVRELSWFWFCQLTFVLTFSTCTKQSRAYIRKVGLCSQDNCKVGNVPGSINIFSCDMYITIQRYIPHRGSAVGIAATGYGLDARDVGV